MSDLLVQRWLPDETLFSLSGRHHHLSGQRLAATTCQQLFGHGQTGSAHDFPGCLAHFAARSQGVLGQAHDIVHGHTLLPFYLQLPTALNPINAYQRMEAGGIGGLKFSLGLLTSRFRANHPLKACHACMQQDRRTVGTPYWHRTQQWPAACVCPVHACPLFASDLKSTGVSRFQWILPRPVHLRFPTCTGKLDDAALQALSAMALLSDRLSKRPMTGPQLDPAVLGLTYRTALARLNLLRGSQIDRRHAGAAFNDHLALLRVAVPLLPLPHNAELAASELYRLTQGRQRSHPVRHLALISWLFNDWDTFEAAYERSAAHLTHPHAAPAALPGRPLRKERVELLELLRKGVAVSTAARRLHVDPATGMAWATAAGIAVHKRPSVLKGERRTKVLEQLARGTSRQAAAQAGGVSVGSVTRLLRTTPRLRETWNAAKKARAQCDARRRWRAVVRIHAKQGIKRCKNACPAAYAWLYRNDREWLRLNLPTRKEKQRGASQRLDWSIRDQRLALSIHAVGRDLLNRMGGPLKLWRLYQVLPDLKAKLGHLKQLPVTARVIDRLTSKAFGKPSVSG